MNVTAMVLLGLVLWRIGSTLWVWVRARALEVGAFTQGLETVTSYSDRPANTSDVMTPGWIESLQAASAARADPVKGRETKGPLFYALLAVILCLALLGLIFAGINYRYLIKNPSRVIFLAACGLTSILGALLQVWSSSTDKTDALGSLRARDVLLPALAAIVSFVAAYQRLDKLGDAPFGLYTSFTGGLAWRSILNLGQKQPD